jgi:glycerophosphoryl diester phosphodiesterase
MAHRGAMHRAPENSAAALELSIADSVEWIEVDVRLTKDEHHILFHDDVVDRKTNCTGGVRALTLSQIRTLDVGATFARRFAGTRLLTLAEGLAIARGRVNLYLDCKDVNPATLAHDVIDAKMTRQVIIYGAPDVLRAVRAAATEELPLMTKWRPRFGISPWVDELRLAAVEIDATDVTREICDEFHRRGIKVQAKTLGLDDRPEFWDRVVVAGVDWIQTDRAEDLIARRIQKSIRSKSVRIAHHRGASRYAPENTLPALEKAILLKADFVEFDIQTTRDGAFVLLHDRTLSRTTSGHGPVRDQDLTSIQLLDAGAWFGSPFAKTRVPSLDAFLKTAGRRVELYVDAKDITPEALVDNLKRYQLTDRAVVYQQEGYLARLQAIEPSIRRMPPLRDAARLDSIAQRVRPFAFDAAWSILSEQLIARCHSKGIQVFSDALGSHERIEDYQRAIRGGIDVIQTDHPLRVLRALELLDQPEQAFRSLRPE